MSPAAVRELSPAMIHHMVATLEAEAEEIDRRQRGG